MKTRNLLLALGCAAAFTACTTNDEPAVAPAMRTVTLSVEVAEPADTRVEYTEEGTTYKFAWAEGDKLCVFYNDDGEEMCDDFDIDATTIDGGKADFTSTTFPADFTGNVTIGYYKAIAPVGQRITQSSPLTMLLAAKTFLYAENVSVSDGQLPDNVKLSHAYAYLLLKEGLLITNETKTVESSDSEMLLTMGTNKGYIFSSNGMQYNPSSQSGNQVRFVYVTNGKLTSDYLVPINVGKEGGDAIELKTYASQSSTKSTEVTQPAHAYVPGKIYEVAAENTNWKATSFE